MLRGKIQSLLMLSVLIRRVTNESYNVYKPTV